MRPMPSRSRQAGLTLLEVLLAIGVSLVVGTVALSEMLRYNASRQAKAVGQQMAAVGLALNTYVALHYPDLVNLTERPAPGSAEDPGPRHCTANVATVDGQPAAICTITTDTLRSSGLLPRNFSGRNAFGASYNIYIRIIGAGPNPIVDGLVVTSTPYTVGGNNRYDLLGQAMQEAGADSAMTRSVATTMEGLNGTWLDGSWPSVTHAGTNFPGVNQLGLLGYRVGYGSSGYAAYLRLDGSTPMTGTLQMDGNNIEDVGALDAGQLSARTAGASLRLNTDGGTTRTELVTGAGALGIRNNTGVVLQNLDGTAAVPLSAGALTVDGNAQLNGDTTVQGNLSAQDLVARRNASVAGDLAVGDDLNVTGTLEIGAAGGNAISTNGNVVVGGSGSVTAPSLIANNSLQVGTYALSNAGLRNGAGSAWYYDSAQTVWRTVGAGLATDRDLSVGTNVAVGGRVQLTGSAAGSTATVLGACAEVGAMRLSTNGNLVQCLDVGGARYWKEMGTRATTADSGNIVANGAAGSVAGSVTCPTGATLVGGGYYLVSRVVGGGGLDSSSPASSYPSGNSWIVVTGQDNGAGTIFRARALCAY